MLNGEPGAFSDRSQVSGDASARRDAADALASAAATAAGLGRPAWISWDSHQSVPAPGMGIRQGTVPPSNPCTASQLRSPRGTPDLPAVGTGTDLPSADPRPSSGSWMRTNRKLRGSSEAPACESGDTRRGSTADRAVPGPHRDDRPLRMLRPVLSPCLL